MGVEDAYDAVAEPYAAQFTDELDRKPFDRELLADLAARVAGPIADIGCGPGHIGASVGAAVGLDLSHEMLRLAPLPVRVRGDMQSMPFANRSLGGAVAFYSLIHLDSLDGAARELHRVIRSGGVLCVAVHEGEGSRHLDEWFGHAVDLTARFWSRSDVTDALVAAGFTIESATTREPYDGELTQRLYVTAIA